MVFRLKNAVLNFFSVEWDGALGKILFCRVPDYVCVSFMIGFLFLRGHRGYRYHFFAMLLRKATFLQFHPVLGKIGRSLVVLFVKTELSIPCPMWIFSNVCRRFCHLRVSSTSSLSFWRQSPILAYFKQ